MKPRFVFEPATPADDAALRRVFARNGMEGDIEVSFRREPSFFLATSAQGDEAQVIACRDTRTGQIVGVGTRALRPGFLNGEIHPLGYLADLRLDAPYRGGGLLLTAYRTLRRLHADGRARLYFTVIAEGNRTALQALAAGSRALPPYRDMGRLLSPAVNLLRRKPAVKGDSRVVRGCPELLPEIAACLDRNMARRQLAPPLGSMLEAQCGPEAAPRAGSGGPPPRLPDLSLDDLYVALRGDRVVGVLGRWDQGRYKQTVVERYRGKVRLLRPAYNAGARLLGLPRFPEPGVPIRSFYASLIAVDEDDTDVFRSLLRRLYNDHVGGPYAYFLAGLHERDPLAPVLREYTLTPYAGRLFAVHYEDGEALFRSLDGRVPYVELAML